MAVTNAAKELVLSATNITKEQEARTGAKEPQDMEPDSTSGGKRKRKNDWESDPLYQFSDIILKAHEDDMVNRVRNSTKDSNRPLETTVFKDIATGDSAPEQKLKGKIIDDLEKPSELRTEICSLKRPESEKGENVDFMAMVQSWANELKNMKDSRQRAIAKKAIDDIFFEAEKETLPENSVQKDTSIPDEQMKQLVQI